MLYICTAVMALRAFLFKSCDQRCRLEDVFR